MTRKNPNIMIRNIEQDDNKIIIMNIEQENKKSVRNSAHYVE